MDEIEALQRELMAAQAVDSVHKLSEFNCIELVNKLKEAGLLDVLYTTNGKEYLTPDQLQREIADEVLTSGGRVAVVELPGVLNVDIQHIERACPEVVKKDADLDLVDGEFIANYYLDDVAHEIQEKLIEEGNISMVSLAKQFNLTTQYMSSVVSRRMGTIIQGHYSAKNNTLYTQAFVQRHAARTRGLATAIMRPAGLADVAEEQGLDLELVRDTVEELVSQGELDATLKGQMYLPNAFSLSQRSAVEDFFRTNQCIEFSRLEKLSIQSEPRSFLQGLYPEGIALETVFVDHTLIDTLEASCEDALSTAGWLDLETVLPSFFATDDIAAFISHLPGGGGAGKGKDAAAAKHELLADHFLVTPAFVASVLDKEREAAAEWAKHFASTNSEAIDVVDNDSSDDEDDASASGKGKGARGGKKGGKSGRQSQAGGSDAGLLGFEYEEGDDDWTGGGGSGKGKKAKKGKRGSGGGGRGGSKQLQGEVGLMLDVEDDDDDWSSGGKGKGKKGKCKKGAKQGGGAGAGSGKKGGKSSAKKGSKNDATRISPEKVAEGLLKRDPNLDDELAEAIAEQIVEQVVTQRKEALAALRRPTDGASRKDKDAVLSRLEAAWLDVQVYSKGAATLAEVDADAVVVKHMFKGIISDAVNIFVEYLHLVCVETEAVVRNVQEREKATKALPEDERVAVASINESLRAKDLDAFAVAFQEAGNACQVFLRPADKKTIRSRTQALRAEAKAAAVTASGEASFGELIFNVCVVLHAHASGQMVTGPGRAIPALLKVLEGEVEEEQHSLLSEFYKTMVEQLKAESGSEEYDSLQRRLETSRPEVLAILEAS